MTARCQDCNISVGSVVIHPIMPRTTYRIRPDITARVQSRFAARVREWRGPFVGVCG